MIAKMQHSPKNNVVYWFYDIFYVIGQLIQSMVSEAERIHKILRIFKVDYFRKASATALESDNLSLKYAATQ